MNRKKYTGTNGLGMLQIAVRSSSNGVAKKINNATSAVRILAIILPTIGLALYTVTAARQVLNHKGFITP